jgi:hypothetical protein
LAVPHPPHFYDRSRRDFSLANSGIGGYIDSLALADAVLGTIRTSMEASQLWDTSMVLISSDHFFRESSGLVGRQEYRVPFLLKLPRQTTGAVYESVFCTTATHDLLVALMDGKISSITEAASWLDGHRRVSDIPKEYLKNPLARRNAH